MFTACRSGTVLLLTLPLKATDSAFHSDGIEDLSEDSSMHSPHEAPAPFFASPLLPPLLPHFDRNVSKSASFLM
jgi:hypothetical protein